MTSTFTQMTEAYSSLVNMVTGFKQLVYPLSQLELLNFTFKFSSTLAR